MELDATPLESAGTITTRVESTLATVLCAGCADATQFSDVITVADGTGDIAALPVGTWVELSAEQFAVVSAADAGGGFATVVLSSAYQGVTEAGLDLLTGDAVAGQIAAGYTSVELTNEELDADRLPETAEPLRYVLTGLQVATAYYARVSAWNDMGWSPSQTSLPVGLAPARQKPDAPTSVTVAVHTGTSLRVFWSNPESDGGDTVAKYKIEWDPQPTFDSGVGGDVTGYYEYAVASSEECGNTPCDYVVGGLAQGTAYFLRVSTYNSFGYSLAATLSTPPSEIPRTQPLPPPPRPCTSSRAPTARPWTCTSRTPPARVART